MNETHEKVLASNQAYPFRTATLDRTIALLCIAVFTQFTATADEQELFQMKGHTTEQCEQEMSKRLGFPVTVDKSKLVFDAEGRILKVVGIRGVASVDDPQLFDSFTPNARSIFLSGVKWQIETPSQRARRHSEMFGRYLSTLEFLAPTQ